MEQQIKAEIEHLLYEELDQVDIKMEPEVKAEIEQVNTDIHYIGQQIQAATELLVHEDIDQVDIKIEQEVSTDADIEQQNKAATEQQDKSEREQKMKVEIEELGKEELVQEEVAEVEISIEQLIDAEIEKQKLKRVPVRHRLRKKDAMIPSDDQYALLVKLLRKEAVPKNSEWEAARKKIRRNDLQLSRVYHPVHGEMRDVITQYGRILPKTSEIDLIIRWSFSISLGQRSAKIYARLKEQFISISEKQVERVMAQYRDAKPVSRSLTNKPVIQSGDVQATIPMECLDVEIVDMCLYPCLVHGKTYTHVLSVVCIMSRFLWLKPLTSCAGNEVTRNLENIFMVFGLPRIMGMTDRKSHVTDEGVTNSNMTDNGVGDNDTEFKAAISSFAKKYHIQVRPGGLQPIRHTMAKVDQSHLAWKRRYELSRRETNDWYSSLGEYASEYNESHHSSTGMSPFELFYGRKSNKRCLTWLTPASNDCDDPRTTAQKHIKKVHRYSDQPRRTSRASSNKILKR